MSTNAGWRERPYRIKIGLGAGPSAGNFEITMDAPEWTGTFEGVAQDKQRTIFFQAEVCRRLARRFPAERVIFLSATPVAMRIRPSWDRP